jgi:lipopolysaccharide/colanic/teichoic acid biosynthesis glycosyltransferase
MRRAEIGRRRALALGVKRAIDLVGSGIGLALLAPVLAGIALAIRVVDGPPVVFRQVRPGLGGVPFRIVKFRTMRSLRPGEVESHSDDVRVTRLGRLLRVTSLDELPELWNVLRGDMSLVGPRPLLVEYLAAYTPEERRRHDVRPGVTGWAAVNGRHALKFRDRLALDVWYVDHWSLRLDARILALTIFQVLRRRGVSATEDVAEVGFPVPALDDTSPGAAGGGPGARGERDGSPAPRRSRG